MERAAKSNIISKIITSLLFALALTGTNIANAQVKVVVIPMFDEVAAAKWRGAWTNATPYDIGDIVEFDDSSYIAKLDHTSSQSITPLDIDTWDLVARGGDDGAQGLKGDTGAAGAQGLKGDTGAAGAQGLKGDMGAQGPQGTNGVTPSKVVWVAKLGGDFTLLSLALNSITDADIDTPYIIKIAPGVYTEPTPGYVLLKDHVDVQGSGEGVTTLKCDCTLDTFLEINNVSTKISQLSVIKSTGTTSGSSLGIFILNSTVNEKRVVLDSVIVKVDGDSSSDNRAITVGAMTNSYPIFHNITASATNGTSYNTGIYFVGEGTTKGVQGVVIDSHIIGSAESIYMATTEGGSIQVLNSKLPNSVTGNGYDCVGAHDASATELGPDCLTAVPPPTSSGGGLSLYDGNNLKLGAIVSLEGRTPITVGILTSTGYFLDLNWAGDMHPGQIYYASAGCDGAALLNAGGPTTRTIYSKTVVFSGTQNSLMTPAVTNNTGAITEAEDTFLAASIDNPTCSDYGTLSANNGWLLQTITPASAGLPASTSATKYQLALPLTVQ
jgi:hypothetical protein